MIWIYIDVIRNQGTQMIHDIKNKKSKNVEHHEPKVGDLDVWLISILLFNFNFWGYGLDKFCNVHFVTISMVMYLRGVVCSSKSIFGKYLST